MLSTHDFQVTKNIAQEFSASWYGKAWDYEYTGGGNDIMEYLSCEDCQVGVANRQTRLLAGLYPTGQLGKKGVEDEDLLDAALRNLEQFAYVGIMERYTDSMLLLKRTFGDRMKPFTQ